MQISTNLKIANTNSAKFARSLGLSKMDSEILLFGLLLATSEKSVKLLEGLGVGSDAIKKYLVSKYKANKTGQIPSSVSYASEATEFFNYATKVCEYNNKNLLQIDDVIYLLMLNKKFYANRLLSDIFKINTLSLSDKLETIVGFKAKTFEEIQAQKNSLDGKVLPKELENLGYDLTEKIKNENFQNVIGRDKETEKVIEILCRKTKNNPVLIGEPGVGKSSVVEGLAKRIVSGNVPSFLENKILFSFDLASLVSGTKFRGSMEQKLKDAISVICQNKNIILFIDEIHTLIQAGAKEGEISPADILKPYLARGELHCIGATTSKEYKDYIEKDPALERRFQPVKVEEPSEQDAIKILRGIKSSFENFHNVKINDDAIVSAVTLSARYITNRFLPDKARDLVDEACSKIKINASTLPEEVKKLNAKISELEKLKEKCWKNEAYIEAYKCKKTITSLKNQIDEIKQRQLSKTGNSFGEVTDSTIREVISSWTNIPLQRISISEKEKLLNLENIIKKRVIGQDEAVSAVCRAIRRSRAGISDPKRPIGSFLFLGPTGVGKTELSKAIGEVLFDDENRIVRFDMSEFKESHSISRLIGTPPGYVGHEAGGELTEAVRKNPYTVVLFDEIEKAHPDIFNILLQIFDDGRLTDSSGKLVNFKNTIIILTSNNGVQDLLERRKFEKENPNVQNVSASEFLMDKLRDRFKPELINRIDQIVIFDILTKDSILKICNIMLNNVIKRLAEKNISLEITPNAKQLICQKGYDSEYGARPLRRVIDREINDPLAEMIVSDKITDNSAIKIDEINGKLHFSILC